MQLNVTGQNINITDPIRNYIETKFDRIKRHFDHLIDAHVVLDVESNLKHAEATITTRGKTFFADAKENDMYAAIDAMVDKVDRQVLKHKEKLREHQHEVPHKNMHLG